MDKRSWTIAEIQQRETREWAERERLANALKHGKKAGAGGRRLQLAIAFALALGVLLASGVYFSATAVALSARAAVITNESTLEVVDWNHPPCDCEGLFTGESRPAPTAEMSAWAIWRASLIRINEATEDFLQSYSGTWIQEQDQTQLSIGTGHKY